MKPNISFSPDEWKVLKYAGTCFLVLVVFAVLKGALDIQKDVLLSSEQEIEILEVPEVRAAANGRLVNLKGVVPEQARMDSLVSNLKSIAAVRTVADHSIVGDPGSIELRTDGRKLRIRGAVPDYRTREILISYAREIYGGRHVSDQTITSEREIDLTWPNMMRTLIEHSKKLGVARVRMSDKVISVILEDDERSDPSSAIGELSELLEPGFRIGRVSQISRSQLSESECRATIEAINGESAIQFGSGSTELESAALEVVEQVFDLLNRCKSFGVKIVGHTDASGSEDSNIRLSSERAAAVAGALRSLGIPERRVNSVGMGSAEPIAGNETPEGKAANRRIEFELTTTGQ